MTSVQGFGARATKTLDDTLQSMRRTIVTRTLPRHVQATNERLLQLDRWVRRWITRCWQQRLSTDETMAAVAMDRQIAMDSQARRARLQYFRARWDAFVRRMEMKAGGAQLQLPIVPTHRSEATTHQSEATTHQSEAPTHQSEAPTHQSEATTHQSEAPTHQSEATTHQSEATTHQSEATTHQSEAPTHQSEATTHQSEATTHRSEATTHLRNIVRSETNVPPFVDRQLLYDQTYGSDTTMFAPAWVVLLAALNAPEWHRRLYRSSVARVALARSPANLDRPDATLQWDIQHSPWCRATLKAATTHQWLRHACSRVADGTLAWHDPATERNPLRAWRWIASALAFNPMLLRPHSSWYGAPGMAWGRSSVTRGIPFVASVDAVGSLDSDSTMVVLLHRADGTEPAPDTLTIRDTRYRLRGMATRDDTAWLCVRPTATMRGGATTAQASESNKGWTYKGEIITKLSELKQGGMLKSLAIKYGVPMFLEEVLNPSNYEIITKLSATVKNLLNKKKNEGPQTYYNPAIMNLVDADQIWALYQAYKTCAKASSDDTGKKARNEGEQGGDNDSSGDEYDESSFFDTVESIDDDVDAEDVSNDTPQKAQNTTSTRIPVAPERETRAAESSVSGNKQYVDFLSCIRNELDNESVQGALVNLASVLRYYGTEDAKFLELYKQSGDKTENIMADSARKHILDHSEKQTRRIIEILKIFLERKNLEMYKELFEKLTRVKSALSTEPEASGTAIKESVSTDWTGMVDSLNQVLRRLNDTFRNETIEHIIGLAKAYSDGHSDKSTDQGSLDDQLDAQLARLKNVINEHHDYDSPDDETPEASVSHTTNSGSKDHKSTLNAKRRQLTVLTIELFLIRLMHLVKSIDEEDVKDIRRYLASSPDDLSSLNTTNWAETYKSSRQFMKRYGSIIRFIRSHPWASVAMFVVALMLLFKFLRRKCPDVQRNDKDDTKRIYGGAAAATDRWYRYAPKRIGKGSAHYFDAADASAALRDSKDKDALAFYLRE